ncbi:MLP-like protein 34 [Syzygium oleosum]|uniref:MLP-like protein 34 n=1 Tax=Syzygium oleosum TaxID=219896 RepID=UPI0011D21D69|nr:MLP-like protein 34 [Syzygium oleosum]
MGQLKRQLELKSSAEKVYDIYRNKCFVFEKIMPLVFPKVELVSGQWNCVGSQRLWTFFDVNCGIWKDTVEAIDNEKKSITWTLLDGPVPKARYESLKVEYQFTAKGQGCTATAVLTFEKKSNDFPDPVKYMDFIHAMFLVVDAHHLAQ